jgi:fructokinase
MADPSFDILGIGNAIVDVLAPVDHTFLSKHNMHPGSMRLIDAQTAESLYAAMPPGTESSGGSVANSCAVAANLGARVAFQGRVAADQLGAAFAHDIQAAGVHYPSQPVPADVPTARCLILVTPDGQRTMNTYLGACVNFGEADLNTADIEAAAVTYLEGYLFDPPFAQAAFIRAARTARAAGRQVALSLSDAFCVDRHRQAFLDLLADVDILFANEAEICALYETPDFADAMVATRADVKLAALTQSEQGSVILSGDDLFAIQAAPAKLVESTGAGDAYAAGFLTAYTQGRDLPACGRLGSLAAAAVIEHFGARPKADLKHLLNA